MHSARMFRLQLMMVAMVLPLCWVSPALIAQTNTADAIDAASIESPPSLPTLDFEYVSFSDDRAWMSLEDVIAMRTEGSQIPDPVLPIGDASEREVQEALRHYGRGRLAMDADDLTTAQGSFHRALSLDPSSIEPRRYLARLSVRHRDRSGALRRYRDILTIDPLDDEALLMLGIDALEKSDRDLAIELLTRPWRRDRRFTHDPAAGVLARYGLFTVLMSEGYHEAACAVGLEAIAMLSDVSTQSMYRSRLGIVLQRRPVMLTAIGDAMLRLGRPGEAADAYLRIDPRRAILFQRDVRLACAHLRDGRADLALQLAVKPVRTGVTLTASHVALTRYVCAHIDDASELRQALLDAHVDERNDINGLRMLAATLPEGEAIGLLRWAMRQHPHELALVRDVLPVRALGREDAAIDDVVWLIDQRPDLATEYVQALVFALADPVATALRLADNPSSVTHAYVSARLLERIGAVGEAWSVVEEARSDERANTLLLGLAMELASMMQATQLFNTLVHDVVDDGDTIVRVAQADALCKLQRHEEAITLLQRLVEASPDDLLLTTALAQCHYSFANASEDQAAIRAHDAARVALRAREQLRLPGMWSGLQRSAPINLLLEIYGPESPIADAPAFQSLLRDLNSSAHDSDIMWQQRGRSWVGQNRMKDAALAASVLRDRDTTDDTALALFMEVQARRLGNEAALAWIEQRREVRPHDPLLLREWVRQLGRMQQTELALDELEARFTKHPSDGTARGLLESIYRSLDRTQDADQVGIERLQRSPRSVSRDLDLALMRVRTGNHVEAIGLLHDAMKQVGVMSREQYINAASMAGQLLLAGRRLDPLAMVTFLEAGDDRFAPLPLQAHAWGLVAAARANVDSERFDGLVERAARSGSEIDPGDAAAFEKDIVQWLALAQALVDVDEHLVAAQAMRARLLVDGWMPAGGTAVYLNAITAILGSQNSGGHDVLLILDELKALGRSVQFGRDEPNATDAQVLYELAIIFTTLGAFDQSETLYQRLLSIEPDHAMAMNNLGYQRVDLGHSDAATAHMVMQALQGAGDDVQVTVLDTVAWLRYKQDRLEGSTFAQSAEDAGALQVMREAMTRATTPSAEMLDHYGDILWRLGRTDEAVDRWREAFDAVRDETYQRRRMQFFQAVQVSRWGVVVATPRELFDAHDGTILRRVERKLIDVRSGREPGIAPQFEN